MMVNPVSWLRTRLLLTRLAPLLLVANCGSGSSDEESLSSQRLEGSAIEYVDCWTEMLRDSNSRCGLLEVPASYDEPEGSRRRVSFAVMPPLEPVAASPNDPVLFLIGGPGPAGSFTDEFGDTGPGSFIRERRELILVDYRGVGMSEPFLGCDGPEDLETCKQVLDDSAMVAELRTAVFARDTDRLLEHLGIETASIYSGSYGTRVALTMLRDVPHRITHVVLDSVFPPEVNGFTQGSRAILAGLNRIAEACQADAACTAELGDIRAQTVSLAAGWATRDDVGELLAVLARFNHFPAAPLLIHELSMMSPEESAQTVAQLLEAFNEGDEDESESESPDGELEPDRSESFVMALGVVCSEEAAFIDRQPLDTERHDFSGPMIEILRSFTGGAPFPPDQAKEVCGMLGIGAAPELEIQPIESDVPTLVLSGGMDLDTSFEWGELAASSLVNGQHYVFPFTGHVVAMEDDCAKTIVSQFIGNPHADLDTSCLQDQLGRSSALVLQSDDVIAELIEQIPPRVR